jgi:hypothetical protein
MVLLQNGRRLSVGCDLDSETLRRLVAVLVQTHDPRRRRALEIEVFANTVFRALRLSGWSSPNQIAVAVGTITYLFSRSIQKRRNNHAVEMVYFSH